ncbi:MAG: hypothetical protein BGO69_15715 [Bacteroidetes bacterium 46-16]|nr:MAG: hypothetical protein BGO69_15715 [Bacteroidetes bacterium 46-16]
MSRKNRSVKANKILPNVLGTYIRVSTPNQESKGYSLGIQRELGQQKAKELGWTYKEYNDGSISGDIEPINRPMVKSLLEDIADDKIGGLFVIKLDRLSRDGDYIDGQVMITMLKKAGIKVFANDMERELQNPAAEMAVRIESVISSYERYLIRERTSSGIRKSIKSGNSANGGAIMAYGFDRKDKKMVINAKEAKVVKQIFELYKKGFGTQRIAGILNDKGIPTKRNTIAAGNMLVKKTITNKSGEKETIKIVKHGKDFVWRDSVVYSMLTNTLYKGEKQWNELIIPVPQIVDADTFDLVQSLLKERTRFKKPIKNQFLLKGLIRCGECGKSFYGHKRADLRDKAYKCLSNRYKAEWCGNRGIGIDYIEDLVWSELLNFEKKVIDTYKWMETDKAVKVYEATIKKSDAIIKDNLEMMDSLTEKYIANKIGDKDYNKFKSRYEAAIEKANAAKSDVENDNFLLVNKKQILDVVKEFTKGMKQTTTFEGMQSYVRAFVDKIVIQSGSPAEGDYYQNVAIYYKMDQFTQFYLKGEVDVMYKRNWHRLRSESKALTVMIHQDVKNRAESFGEALHVTGF